MTGEKTGDFGEQPDGDVAGLAACPDEQQLSDLLDGVATVEMVAQIESHLASCQTCVDRLDRLSAGETQAPFRRMISEVKKPARIGPQADRSTLERADATTPAQDTDESNDSAPWPELHGYSIVREIARGGMGVVYEATDNELGRQVAIKMITGGLLAGPERISRFLEEARTVARLKHGNIVQVYDVGECQGQPYFSMELIEGDSLAARLDGGPWEPPRAAKLTATLAKAIAVAHKNQIVHRDLKPANILLDDANENGSDSPKIVDFGLAKNFASEDITKTGEAMGTPSYMSPEQAGGRTKEVNARTDIYSLGSILYELLTGRPPFRTASIAETLHQILHDEPARPRSLNGAIPVDLETICLKCLQKDQTARYSDVDALAEDLQRFVDGRPILAKPVSSWKKATLWCRRHPSLTALGLVTAAAVVVILTLWVRFTASLAQQTEIARVESVNAKANEKLARKKEAEAQENLKQSLENNKIQREVQQLLGDLVQQFSHFGKDELTLQAMKITEEKARQRVGDRVRVHRAYLLTLAHTYQYLGAYDDALRLLNECEELFVEPDFISDKQFNRLRLVRVQVYMQLDRVDEARRELAELELETSNFYADDVDVLLFQICQADYMAGDLPGAEKNLRVLLGFIESRKGKAWPLPYGMMATVLLQQKKLPEAEEYTKLYVKLSREQFPPDHPKVLHAEGSHAIFLSQTGRADEAEPILRRCLEIQADKFGDDDAQTIEAIASLAKCLSRQKKFEDAKSLYETGIETSARELGIRHMLTVGMLRNYQRDLMQQKLYQDAFNFLKPICDLQEMSKATNTNAGHFLLNFARVCVAVKEWDMADDALDAAATVNGNAKKQDAALARMVSGGKELLQQRKDALKKSD